MSNIAGTFGLPSLDISWLDISTIPDDIKNSKLIEKHRCLPLCKRNNRLILATSNPNNLVALEEFQFSLGLHVEPIIVVQQALDKIIDKVLEADLDQLDISEDDENRLAGIDTDNSDDSDHTDVSADDAPVVVFINKLMTEAIRKGASDLHFEPYENQYRVRFRIDGMLSTITAPPQGLGPRISARIKVMAKLDIAERRLPQDGRIKLRVGNKKMVDFRVSVLPTLFGEKVVMRILDSSAANLNIDILGFSEQQKALYQQNLQRPQGMILVTGPTGSGKTVSLYTGLNILNTEERNISTAEDPVEINLPGINQVQIHPKAGLTFAGALRSFLRQDPDIVMVGEIRDLETAEIAVKAAQTGHMVMSTLHTNSAPETLTRLLNMGVPAYNIASSVSLIIAQRLGRKLCPNCKQPEQIPSIELLQAGFSHQQIDAGITLFKPKGCDNCNGGYKGRIGLYEMLTMTTEMAALIMDGGSALDLAKQAKKDGMVTLRQSALEKVIDGTTSLAEVNRVTSH
ncbi:type IV-A pilus assembly ATPase PilB [Ferrimonas lipolytica]|uniref:Type IV-A pilus assembly ATPase PilB n=1 Tax=Ferrimonas lipolytica TaxID=2724191 RepID=A0A6H1UIU2_9GAMM|nr:type IV-A pilus assembly ATPase PilB [Ferrimonas lipolytica]QIZ78549.1 type IV-A pilus assembly ATPase PilB [Ferrimonas lipolytica]